MLYSGPQTYETATGVYEVNDRLMGGDTNTLMTATETELNDHLIDSHLHGSAFFMGTFGFQFDGELAWVLGHSLDRFAEKADGVFVELTNPGGEAVPFLQQLYAADRDHVVNVLDISDPDSLRRHYVSQGYHHLIAAGMNSVIGLGVINKDKLSPELIDAITETRYAVPQDSFFHRFRVQRIR